MSQQCTVCPRPTDTMLCRWCWDELAHDLRRTAWFVDELTTVLMKHTAVAHTSVGFVTGTHEQPLVFSTEASDVLADLRSVLAVWVRELWRVNAVDGATLDVTPEPVELASWIVRHPTWVCGHPDASQLHDEIGDAYRRAARLIDLPPERFYAGQCNPTRQDGATPDDTTREPCEQHLWGRYDRATVVCPACDTAHDVTTRRQALLRRIEREQITAPDISRLLAKFGIELPASTIRGYAQDITSRGKVIPARIKLVDRNEKGHPLYLVRDVLDVWFRRHDTAAA